MKRLDELSREELSNLVHDWGTNKVASDNKELFPATLTDLYEQVFNIFVSCLLSARGFEGVDIPENVKQCNNLCLGYLKAYSDNVNFAAQLNCSNTANELFDTLLSGADGVVTACINGFKKENCIDKDLSITDTSLTGIAYDEVLYVLYTVLVDIEIAKIKSQSMDTILDSIKTFCSSYKLDKSVANSLSEVQIDNLIKSMAICGVYGEIGKKMSTYMADMDSKKDSVDDFNSVVECMFCEVIDSK